MTSLHVLSGNVEVLPNRNDSMNSFEDMPDEKLKPAALCRSKSLVTPSRGKCPPRWQRNKKPSKQKSDSSSSKREEFINSIKQAVDLSFYVTSSSISSLGDGSITSTFDDDDSDSSVITPTNNKQQQVGRHCLPELGFKDMPPLASFRSTRSADRWDMVSHDSLPATQPFRQSLELPRRSKDPQVARRASYAGDTLPKMPARRHETRES